MIRLIWGTPQRKALSSLGGAALMIFGLVTQGPAAFEAWDGQGLPTFATRGWVRPHLAQLKDIQTDIANGKLESAQRDRDRLELDYLKAQSDEERIKNKQLQRGAQETIDKLKSQLDSLRGK